MARVLCVGILKRSDNSSGLGKNLKLARALYVHVVLYVHVRVCARTRVCTRMSAYECNVG